MPRTYTDYKLTDPMLQRWSKMCNGRPTGGVSAYALQDRGLATMHLRPTRVTWEPTAAGRAALDDARAEGW